MVACPRCGDERSSDAVTCSTCGEPAPPVEPPRADALLGRFHPLVVERLERLLTHRGIDHERHVRDHDVELRVDATYRDDLRAELVSSWAQIVHTLPEDRAMEVLASGGAAPGWFDAPAGGWVDRAGRLVVEPSADDPTALSTPRMTGPVMAGFGLLLLLLGWFTGAGDAVMMVGGALTVIGMLVPR